jgi:hypothetical protein
MRSAATGPVPTTGGKVAWVAADDKSYAQEAARLVSLRSRWGEAKSCAGHEFSGRRDLRATDFPLAIAARRELERLTAEASQAMGRYLTEQHPLPARVSPDRSSAHAAISSARD